jgi:hypothetical protein
VLIYLVQPKDLVVFLCSDASLLIFILLLVLASPVVSSQVELVLLLCPESSCSCLSTIISSHQGMVSDFSALHYVLDIFKLVVSFLNLSIAKYLLINGLEKKIILQS